MRKWFDTKHFKTAIYTLFVIILGILFYHFLGNIGIVTKNARVFLTAVLKILTPILYGTLFAFLMSPGVNWFEEKLILLSENISKDSSKPRNRKLYRTISILIVYVFIFGFLFFSIHYIVPMIFSNIGDLYNNLPHYLESLENTILSLRQSADNSAIYIPKEVIDNFLGGLQLSKISPEFINSLITKVLSSAISITSVTLNIALGCVIAFYLLKQKEDFAEGSIKIAYAFLNKETGTKLISFAKESNHIFTKFFIGKSVDSLIIGLICFLGLSLLRNPYALLLSLIIGVTNMIPYFGPFIGGIPAVIITLFEGLVPAIFVALFILALQQFDALVLGPKILGDSIGLSPFWIITSIIIGGALWGPLGMFFGAPICAILLLAINRWLDKRLISKDIDIDNKLPDTQ